MDMFEYFRHFVETEDTKILFVLCLICVAMVLDFLTGVVAAKMNPDIEFKSKIGINGILRKMVSFFLLAFFIPVSVIVPGGAGTALLYTLYLGYLLMELKSILENYQKIGGTSDLFQRFINSFTSHEETKSNKREDENE
ncbi:phage holin family protein [Enterococcus hirae]|uniref:phage holin family protein n=1 Tax=Enterococcus hirae TaxID=1354 RepID=UPI000F71C3A5|nr:phage holin family protein [Enterococcus hirae]VEE82030.1 phage Holin 4 family protein [Enterococcus hirae]